MKNPLGNNLLLLYIIKKKIFFHLAFCLDESFCLNLFQQKVYVIKIDFKACRYFMIHK